MHTLSGTVNGQKIYHWSLGDVYYITDSEGNWVVENQSFDVVVDAARNKQLLNESQSERS